MQTRHQYSKMSIITLSKSNVEENKLPSIHYTFILITSVE